MDPKVELNTFYAVHCLPAHTFALVSSVKPDLQLAFTDLEWTKKFLTENPAALKHEFVQVGDEPERLVLTASTTELQKFWVEHAKTEGAFFGEPTELKRQAQPPAPKEMPKEPSKDASKNAPT
jgi:hypothetical protein